MALIAGGQPTTKKGAQVVEALVPWLAPGETVRLLVKTNNMRPMLDRLAVTNARLLAFRSSDVRTKGPRISVLQADLATGVVRKSASAPRRVVATLHTGEEVNLGALMGSDDVALVDEAMRTLTTAEEMPSVAEAIRTLRSPAEMATDSAVRNETAEANQAAGPAQAFEPAAMSDPSVHVSEKDRKRTEREAQKEETRQHKAELRDQKQAAATARAEAERKQCGREVGSGAFGFKRIQIYEHGFVKVSGLLERSANVTPRRLLSIEASADVGKKSGVGRGVGAAMTLGLNLVGSNMRGDVYLTIVTDGPTYALSETPPTPTNMKTCKKLEAVGNSVLRDREDAAEPGTNSMGTQTGGARERLAELKALLDDRLITQQEYDEKRRTLLESL